MLEWWFRVIIFRLLLATPVVISLIQYKKLDKASKYIALLLLLNLLTEILAVWGAYQFQQSNIVYNIHGPIDLFIVCLYFHFLIDSFRENKISILIGLAGLAFAIVNAIFFQSIKHLNTYFLAVQSLLTVFMCLYYFYDFLRKDSYSDKLPIHFWFTALLLIYWSITLFQWIVGLSIMYTSSAVSTWTHYIILSINVITYIAFAVLFYNYNKFELSGRD